MWVVKDGICINLDNVSMIKKASSLDDGPYYKITFYFNHSSLTGREHRFFQYTSPERRDEAFDLITNFLSKNFPFVSLDYNF